MLTKAVSTHGTLSFLREMRQSKRALMTVGPDKHPANLLARSTPLTPLEQRTYLDIILEGARVSRTLTTGEQGRANLQPEGVSKAQVAEVSDAGLRRAAEWILREAHTLPLNLDTAVELNRLLTEGAIQTPADPFYFSNPQPFFRWLESNAAHRLGTNDPVALAERIHTEGGGLDSFPEGNGRTFRLLADLALIKYGRAPVRYPPQAVYFETASPVRLRKTPTEGQLFGGSNKRTTEYDLGERAKVRDHFYALAEEGQRAADEKLGQVTPRTEKRAPLPPVTEQFFMYDTGRTLRRQTPYQRPQPLAEGERPNDPKRYRRHLQTAQTLGSRGAELVEEQGPFRTHVVDLVPGLRPAWTVHEGERVDLARTVYVIHEPSGHVYRAEPGDAGSSFYGSERPPETVRDVRGNRVPLRAALRGKVGPPYVENGRLTFRDEFVELP